MIIPVRCFTCNNMIASKYKKYQELLKKTEFLNLTENILTPNPDVQKEINSSNVRIFEELGLKRYCCRRHLISHVDLIHKI